MRSGTRCLTRNTEKLQEADECMIHLAALILFLSMVGADSSQRHVLALVFDNVHSDHQIVKVFAAGLSVSPRTRQAASRCCGSNGAMWLLNSLLRQFVLDASTLAEVASGRGRTIGAQGRRQVPLRKPVKARQLPGRRGGLYSASRAKSVVLLTSRSI